LTTTPSYSQVPVPPAPDPSEPKSWTCRWRGESDRTWRTVIRVHESEDTVAHVLWTGDGPSERQRRPSESPDSRRAHTDAVNVLPDRTAASPALSTSWRSPASSP